MIIADPGKSYFNALSGLTQMAQQQGQIKRQNALQDFYSTHGQALAQGDQGAINALAAIDGQAAYQMRRQSAADARATQSHEMGMQTSQANLKAITARAEREAARWAADKDAAEVERELANHNRVLSALSTVDSPEAWDAMAQQMGEDEIVGQFGQREALFAQQIGLKNALERQKGPEPLSPEGKRAMDARNGIIDLDLPQVDFETEQKLRKEFLGIPAVKAFSEQAQAFGRIESSAKDPSPAGDLALIFNFMKVLDPGSVVRESEFATAESAAAWLQQSEEAGITVPLPVARSIRKMATGQRLSPEQRQDFVSRGRALYADAEQGFVRLKGQYEEKAKAYNLDPERSLTDFRRPVPAETPTTSKQVQPAGGQITMTPEQKSVFDRYSP